MGYNTTVVVMNDALGFIESDPEFGRKLAAAIMEASAYRKRVDVGARSTGGGIHCNAATVIESHHADHDVYVKVGGNMGEVVSLPCGPVWRPIESAPRDGTEILLTTWSQENGYGETDFGCWDFIEKSDADGRDIWYWASNYGRVDEPTHWMPCPSSPATGEQR